jgi:hypothetical protein
MLVLNSEIKGKQLNYNNISFNRVLTLLIRCFNFIGVSLLYEKNCNKGYPSTVR